ncbi:MAG TPA: alpha/beta hydrolase [Campylobacterales bacterium]|nr:alpha/beta hydrolase [Campylobacterales bacterium]
MEKNMDNNIVFIVLTVAVTLLFFTGCSGKRAYKVAIGFQKYQANLTQKETTILGDLKMVYLENDVQSDKTLVLIHGFGANKENWLYLAKELGDRYHIIAPDLVGDGESSKPMDLDYSIENQAKMLHEFLLNFRDKNLVLVGNSQGGHIALEYAYKHRVDALVLINAQGIKVEESVMDKLGREKLEEMYLNVCTVDKMKKMMEIGFSKPPYVPDFILKYLTEEKCKVSKLDRIKYEAVLDDNLSLLNDMTLKSQEITVPTLIIWGKEDKVFSLKNAYAFNQYLKNSELVILDALGHMPMIEDAEVTAESIEKFLAEMK